MTYQEQPSEEEKIQFLKILVDFSKSDNFLSPEEVFYIKQVASSAGISDEIYDEIIKDHSDLHIDFPKSEQERMSMLYYLLFLMKIDKNVDPNEEKLIYHYGFKLGFSESMLREMIHLIKSKVDQKIPPADMLSIIKKYLN